MIQVPLRVGVAGCGQIARRLHIPGYLGCAKCQLMAMYNHRLDSVADLRAAYPYAEIWDDYERFLDSSGVQAISVCTPNALHAGMTIAALRRGIHVLVEKPMAVTLAEAASMMAAARDSGALLMVGQSHRYLYGYREAYQLLQSGILGRIHQVSATLAHSGPLDWSPRGQWFVTARWAGRGVIGDLAVHMVDMVRHLTGQEVEQVAAFDAAFEQREVEDNTVAVLRLSGGALATVTASWTTRGESIDSVILTGEHGSLQVGVEPEAPLVAYLAPDERRVFDLPEAGDDAQMAEVSEFVEAVLGERANPIPAEEGYHALEVCIAIERSAQSGQVIRLPL